MLKLLAFLLLRTFRWAYAQVDASLVARARAVHAFLDSGGDSRCDLLRINAREIDREAFEARAVRYGAVMLTNVSPHIEQRELTSVWTRQHLLENFGDYRVHLDNGHLDANLRVQSVSKLKEHLMHNESSMGLFMAAQGHSFQQKLLKALPHPPLFDGFDARPVLTLGLGTRALHFHTHLETWLYLLAGRKAWWLVLDGTATLPGVGDPCTALMPPLPYHFPGSLRLCVQRPGEVLYFANNTPHATCNLDDFVFGFGAQGRSVTWPWLERAAHVGNITELQRPFVAKEEDIVKARALKRALEAGHIAAVALLVQAQASLSVDTVSDAGLDLSQMGMSDTAELLEAWESAMTPDEALHIRRQEAFDTAAMYGHGVALQHLLDRKASVNARSSDGLQPLHRAAASSDSSTVEFLLKKKAKLHSKSSLGRQAIHLASAAGHSSIVAALLSAKTKVNVADDDGQTPLQMAAASNRDGETVLQLMSKRADHRAVQAERDGYSAVHIAAHAGHAPVVEALLKSHASPEFEDAVLRRPAHVAAWRGHSEVIEVLKAGGADLSAVAGLGLRPSHFAASSGHLSVMKMLHASHVDLYAGDGRGRSPRALAEESGHADVAEFLASLRKDQKRRRHRKSASAKMEL